MNSKYDRVMLCSSGLWVSKLDVYELIKPYPILNNKYNVEAGTKAYKVSMLTHYNKPTIFNELGFPFDDGLAYFVDKFNMVCAYGSKNPSEEFKETFYQQAMERGLFHIDAEKIKNTVRNLFIDKWEVEQYPEFWRKIELIKTFDNNNNEIYINETV